VKIEELTRTRRRLSEKQRLAAVGEALSKISHEIQNKVGGVGVWVQNLERFGARDENSRMCVAELRSAIDGLLDMLIHFKRFYRLPAVDPRPVEAQTVLRECAARAEAAARAKEVAVEWEAPAAPLTAAADPPQLTDALVNLVLNAVEASPSGGAVTLSLRAEDGWAVYSVRDRGPGIPPKARIFRPFFTTKPSGSGLGLSIVRNIARAHRGHVRAFNPPGGGACFEIRVPAVSGDTP
jgi:signal transduction histidine kinase